MLEAVKVRAKKVGRVLRPVAKRRRTLWKIYHRLVGKRQPPCGPGLGQAVLVLAMAASLRREHCAREDLGS